MAKKTTIVIDNIGFNVASIAKKLEVDFIAEKTHLYPGYSDAARAQKLREAYAQIKEQAEKNAPKEEVEHVITEQDLTNNPELRNEGVQVGEAVTYTAEPNQAEGESGSAKQPRGKR